MGTHPIFESDFDCLTEKKHVSCWSVWCIAHCHNAVAHEPLFQPQLPRNGQCEKVCRLHEGHSRRTSVWLFARSEVDTYNILSEDNMREEVKEFSDWPTFPQVYLAGEFYAGCDIMYDDYKEEKLRSILLEAGLTLPKL